MVSQFPFQKNNGCEVKKHNSYLICTHFVTYMKENISKTIIYH